MKILRKNTKRENGVRNGMRETKYMVKREGDTCYRRIYEHWSRINKHGSDDTKRWEVPLVIKVKGELLPFDLANMPSAYTRGE